MIGYKGHRDQKYGHISYSQHGEDLFILNVFTLLGYDIKAVRYLDIGAHHPETISNTKLLYDRGARGVNVDANKKVIELFERDRPEDLNLCLGVGVTSGVKPFLMYDEYSGRNTFSPEEVERANIGRPIKRIEDVDVVTLRSLLELCGPFDFLSIDIEGLDYEVLRSVNPEIYDGVKVICVETRVEETHRMIELLTGYQFRIAGRFGENLILIHVDTYYKYLGFM